MPDWSYRPILRPLLFRLPPELARDVTLSALGTLASLPLGAALIDTLGDMRPPPSAATTAFGLEFPSVVGLGAGLDVHGVALAALARFGFGFLEVGPVAVDRVPLQGTIRRDLDCEALSYPLPLESAGLTALAKRLSRLRPLGIPLGVRLSHRPGASAVEASAELEVLIARLSPLVSFLSLDAIGDPYDDTWSSSTWRELLSNVTKALARCAVAQRLLVGVPPDLGDGRLAELVDPAVELGLRGVIVGGRARYG